jgi:molybdopterin synthase sulfur carrier subunit
MGVELVAKVRIPTALRRLTGNLAEVEVAGSTVREVLEDLDRRFPGVRERLLDGEGALRRFVNVYVGDEDIRFLQGLDTSVEEASVISIVPAVAGGR